MKLYLVGLPGSGKSFLGKQLADEAKLPFIDLDQIIQEGMGESISAIFSHKGETYFRNLEAVALRQQSKAAEFVMACGGGTPCFHDNMSFICESGKSIFLNLPVSEIVRRIDTEERKTRPLLSDTKPEELEEKLKTLLKNRITFYTQATLTLTGGNSSPAEILSRLKM